MYVRVCVCMFVGINTCVLMNMNKSDIHLYQTTQKYGREMN